MSAPPWTLPMIAVPDFVPRTDASATAENVIAAVARAEGVREIEELIAAGMKMDAVYKALEVYGIDASHVEKLAYTPDLTYDGLATRSLTVEVGEGAFTSAAWLGSVLSHEIEVHIEQFRELGSGTLGPVRFSIIQVEAFDHQIATAERFGLSKKEVAEKVEDARRSHYLRLDEEYKKRVDAGIYDMKPGDEDK